VSTPLGARMHPAVVSRRLHDLALLGACALVPLIAGLAITLIYKEPNPLLLFGGLAAIAAIVLLLLSPRYEITLALLLLYLGIADGPIKLEAASVVASGMRDIFIVAIGLGMLLRLAVGKSKVGVPPLSLWVVGFVAFVLADALNPHTISFLKALGGWRQQLEWVPFFFFGYMMMRSKQRFRQLFILLGVIALANGLVGTVQARLTPSQLASWGPGYHELVKGGEGNGITGRTYSVNGEARARPPALGSDSGFGGGVGSLALPCLLALLAASPTRRRWLVGLLCMGAVLGIATAASRTSVVVGVIGMLSFAGLSLLGGLKVSRTLLGVLVTALIVIVVGSVLIAANGNGIFARQETLTSVSRAEETGGNSKQQTLGEIPTDLIHAPLGYGLGIAGAVSGFGGKAPAHFEGTRVMGGSAYSLLMKEVGAPGLLLWVGLTVNVLLLAVRWLRRIADPELRTYLAGLIAGYVAITVEGLSGPTLAVTIGAFLWFVPGVAAYWFGTARKAATTPLEPPPPRQEPGPPVFVTPRPVWAV
jgi:hypothetical protein